jgi:hypothetical protein
MHRCAPRRKQVVMPIANPLETDLAVATAARRVGLSASTRVGELRSIAAVGEFPVRLIRGRDRRL